MVTDRTAGVASSVTTTVVFGGGPDADRDDARIGSTAHVRRRAQLGVVERDVAGSRLAPCRRAPRRMPCAVSAGVDAVVEWSAVRRRPWRTSSRRERRRRPSPWPGRVPRRVSCCRVWRSVPATWPSAHPGRPRDGSIGPKWRPSQRFSPEPRAHVGAFFDLDGTLVQGFTAAVHLGHRIRNRRPESASDRNARSGTALPLRRMKFEHLLTRAGGYLRGESLSELDELGHRLYAQHIESRVHTEMRDIVRAHRAAGHTWWCARRR